MRRYLTIFRLKLLDLLAMRGLILVFAIVPLLLGLLAGTANLGNQRSDVRLAVIDQDESEDSSNLIRRLSRNGWPVEVTSENEAARLLLQNKVDGMIFIEKGFSASLSDLKASRLRYVEAEGSLVTSIVREAVAAAVLPDYSEQYLLNQIKGRYLEIGQTAPAGLEASFDTAMAAYAAGMTRLNVDYIGQIKPVPTLTLLVSDYSIEVVFLSVFAVLGMTMLSRPALRRRLAAARYGILQDYMASLAGLMLVGFCQVILYTGAMWLLMKAVPRLEDIAMMAIFLCLMLGIGQLLSLISQNLRIYLSLLILLLSAVAGGCFFPLSEKLLGLIGQYTPHGWIISTLKGYPALPAYVPLAIALVLLVLGYGLQLKRVPGDH